MHQWKGLHEYYSKETQEFEKKSKSLKLTKWNFVRTPSFRTLIKEIVLASLISVLLIPTRVIDMSMEMSSRVLQNGNQKIWFFFLKFEIEFDLYFDLCWRAEIIIQVGLNMHLYVDIGDASSSLWGSTSSFIIFLDILKIFDH